MLYRNHKEIKMEIWWITAIQETCSLLAELDECATLDTTLYTYDNDRYLVRELSARYYEI